MTDIQQRVTEALIAEHYRRAREKILASPEEHQAAFATIVMAIVQPALDTKDARIESAERRAEAHHRAMSETAKAAADRLGELAAERDSWRARAESAEATVARVRELHSRSDAYCEHCMNLGNEGLWPCTTIRALEETPGDPA